MDRAIRPPPTSRRALFAPSREPHVSRRANNPPSIRPDTATIHTQPPEDYLVARDEKGEYIVNAPSSAYKNVGRETDEETGTS